MKTYRRFGFALLALITLAGPASAAYPERPIRLVVPAAPGGASDIMGRILGDELSRTLGQQIVVESRPGATGNIAAVSVATAPPDGYTLLFGETAILAINPHLYKRVGFDPIADFAPISLVAAFPFVLVAHPGVPGSTIAELVAYAKSRPGGLSYGTPGPGSPHHLGAELFRNMTGTPMTHVPYKGGAPATADLLGGQIQIGFIGLPPLVPHLKAGKLKAFAVSSATRAAAAPELPTMIEAGLPGYDSSVWYGVLAPKGTPTEIVERLNTAIRAALDKPEIQKKLLEQGANTLSGAPAEFRALIQSENVKWSEVVKTSGAKAD